MISAKFHKSDGELLLAACDTDLLGRTLNFKNGAKVFINPSFYSGEKVSETKLSEMLTESTSANLFGAKTINAAVKFKHLTKNATIDVEGIPHSQIIKML